MKSKVISHNDNKSKIILILVVLVALVVLGFLINKKYLKVSFLDNKKVELKQTSVNTKIKEGIYITDVSEIVEETMPSIVSITSKTLIQSGYFGPFNYGNEKQYAEGAGSGIIISQSDDEVLILTNNHVVADSSELTVKFINDKTADATIKGTSEKKDVAVISVKLDDLDKETKEAIKIATLGSSDDLKVGNGIIAIGNALGYGQSVTTGVVSALNREIVDDESNNKMIQIDAAINGGNSGGALLNNKGEVIGINSAKYSSNSSSSASIEGMGFAIPISDVKDLITDLMNGKKEDKKITLGIEGYMTNNSYLQGYSFPSGFYISNIVEGSYAEKSELDVGNIITEIDGNEVNELSDISKVLAEKKEGDSVKLKIKYISNRKYKEKEVTIEFK